jgi:ribosome biogenesis GTPase / thiamine phosphate phosphatase
VTLASLGWRPAMARDLPEGTRPARVVAVHGALATAATGEEVLLCPMRSLDGPPATGDWAALDAAGTIVALLPRRGVVEREGGVLATHVDVVLVAVPCDAPDDLQRAARLAALGPDPVLVVTKADAGDAGAMAEALRAAVPGAPLVVCSARTGEGLDAVRALLPAGTTGALLGRSGAGKSSLVNALLGAEVQAVAAVRARDAEGRHTTTRRELLPLPGGGCLVDMPGMKLPRMSARAAPADDIDALALGCRFADCLHADEPGCAVRDEVDPERLEAWRRLAREREQAERREEERRARGRAGSRLVREALRAKGKR